MRKPFAKSRKRTLIIVIFFIFTVSSERDKSLALSAQSLDKKINHNLTPIISEILANPEGSDGKNEWLEIYNPHYSALDISNWTITSEEKNLKKFPANTILKGGKYQIVPLTLPNTETQIKLKNALEHTIEEIIYPQAQEGLSWSLIKIETPHQTITTEWQWLEPSPNKPNSKPITEKKAPESELILALQNKEMKTKKTKINWPLILLGACVLATSILYKLHYKSSEQPHHE